MYTSLNLLSSRSDLILFALIARSLFVTTYLNRIHLLQQLDSKEKRKQISSAFEIKNRPLKIERTVLKS